MRNNNFELYFQEILSDSSLYLNDGMIIITVERPSKHGGMRGRVLYENKTIWIVLFVIILKWFSKLR